MKRNQSGQHISFQENSLANGFGLTGLTGISVLIEIDGGGQSTGLGGVTPQANGAYKYLFTQAETNGYQIAIQISHPEAITQVMNIYTDDGLQVEVAKIIKSGETARNVQGTVHTNKDVEVTATRV
jgi:hypothetical protein